MTYQNVGTAELQFRGRAVQPGERFTVEDADRAQAEYFVRTGTVLIVAEAEEA